MRVNFEGWMRKTSYACRCLEILSMTSIYMLGLAGCPGGSKWGYDDNEVLTTDLVVISMKMMSKR
jgi:hypothetical protein